MSWLSSQEARLGLALAVGLLIGAEREQRRAEQAIRGFAGLRTFGLVGFLGGLFGYLALTPLIVTGGLVVGGAAIAAYFVNRDDPDRGMTTELALVVTYGLGLLAMNRPLLAAASAVIIASLLALRGWLHKLVRETLTREELRDVLVFLLFALVMLPAAPDVNIGPFDAINPQSLTRLIVVLMAFSAAAYVAQRLLGPRFGLAFTGFMGGFVSSSATIATMSMRAREHPAAWRSAAAGALASSIATVLQYVFIVAAVGPGLVVVFAPSMGLAGVAALVTAGSLTWLAMKEPITHQSSGRPFRFSIALGFATVFVVVSIASAALHERFGSAGIVVVSALAALVDAHSTAGSVASLHHGRVLDSETAELALVTALSANTLTKIMLAWTGRHLRFGIFVTAGVSAIAGAAWLGLLL